MENNMKLTIATALVIAISAGVAHASGSCASCPEWHCGAHQSDAMAWEEVKEIISRIAKNDNLPGENISTADGSDKALNDAVARAFQARKELIDAIARDRKTNQHTRGCSTNP
jgi:hypothetical protein